MNELICIRFTKHIPSDTPGFGVWFCVLFILTMRKNALHREPLSTWHQSPARATDRPACQEGTEGMFTFTSRRVPDVRKHRFLPRTHRAQEP